MDVKGEQTVANVTFGPVTSPAVRYRFRRVILETLCSMLIVEE